MSQADWIRNPSDALAVEQGCTFSPGPGERVIGFLERFCRQSKGEWANKPIQVLPWQKDFLTRLYGWKQADGTRRFRTFYVEVAKKNGKSTLLSGLALYHLLADAEPSAECYICACDKKQASIIFDESRRMVEKSPDLRTRLEVIPSKKLISHDSGGSKLEALSADVPSKDGVNASFVIFDELHRQPTPAMWRVMRWSGASRRQPLIGAITTCGESESGVWFEQRRLTEDINRGINPDITHLGVIHAAEPTDDIDDPAVWKKANPSLGVTIKESTFKGELEQAKQSPGELAEFKRLRLGIITASERSFLDDEAWKACQDTFDEQDLIGEACFGGLDLSSTTDLAAFALFFPATETRSARLLVRLWVPEESAERRERINRVQYRTWGQSGYLTLTEGASIDYEAIEKAVVDASNLFDLRAVYGDPWNAKQLLTRLDQLHGIEVVEIRQGFASLSAPTKELERLVLSKEVRHDGNPVLAWNARNAVVSRDSAGNVKLNKDKSREKIDGLSAAVNAIAGATAGNTGEESVYEHQGIQFI